MPNDNKPPNHPPSLIIIVVSVAACTVLLLILFALCLTRRRRQQRRTAPLPPVQALAHHREKRLNTLGLGPPPPRQHLDVPLDSPWSASEASLRAESTAQLIYTPDDPSTLAQTPGDTPLSPPTPAFALGPNGSSTTHLARAHSPADSSLDGSDDAGLMQQPPLRHRSSSPSAAQAHPHPQHHERRRSAATSVNSSLRRPHSIAASMASAHPSQTRSVRGARSVSTIRGAPHRPHSRVEIVLPTPLAPQLYPQSDDTRIEMEYFNRQRTTDRRLSVAAPDARPVSMVDAWIQIGRGDATPTAAPPVPRGSRTPDKKLRRTSESQTTSAATAGMRSSISTGSQQSSRLNSSTPQASDTRLSGEEEDAPPVPRLPSMYGDHPSYATLPASEAHLVDKRGRHSPGGEGDLRSEPSRRSDSKPRTTSGGKLRKPLPGQS